MRSRCAIRSSEGYRKARNVIGLHGLRSLYTATKRPHCNMTVIAAQRRLCGNCDPDHADRPGPCGSAPVGSCYPTTCHWRLRNSLGRLHHNQRAALPNQPGEPNTLLRKAAFYAEILTILKAYQERVRIFLIFCSLSGSCCLIMRQNTVLKLTFTHEIHKFCTVNVSEIG
jgi:hypothetical protein